ncbi:PepSY domain-containing protein [Methanobacterium sp.]|uniref:PepSY domain-containing protein n=1 Tax=Methanobacterium sp. TaxID=2164 RepID=UPI003C70F071
MMKKIIVAILVVAAVSGFVYATYGNTSGNNTTNNSTTLGTQTQQINNSTQNTNSNTPTQTTTKTAISSAEAMKIANTYIEVSNATAGTPSLVTQNNKLVYVVPVIDNGTNVGEIDIDAQTGANLGGAGGSP